MVVVGCHLGCLGLVVVLLGSLLGLLLGVGIWVPGAIEYVYLCGWSEEVLKVLEELWYGWEVLDGCVDGDVGEVLGGYRGVEDIGVCELELLGIGEEAGGLG